MKMASRLIRYRGERMDSMSLDETILLDRYEAYGDLRSSVLVPWITDIRWVNRRHDGNPHVQLAMVQHTPPTEELLRTELLTLLGVMITRLGVEDLAEHRVMPVMALSCFQGARARIVQAFMTDTGLAICKTSLFDFTDQENREDTIETCLSYLASTPVGDTRRLNYRPPPPLKDE
ncbi:hypothetical protein BJY04DRAFT_27853 [Aspergillus karnatakaensis]|uniref:uncharacterized protein n=1 Tax=Aspergillus karnatakaensis TaxID=1810916 RepID=UPI003CCCD40D